MPPIRILLDKIKAAAAIFGIDPIHIIGAIVGEHTYNVDLLDSLQDASVSLRTYLDSKAAAWLGVALRFGNRQTGKASPISSPARNSPNAPSRRTITNCGRAAITSGGRSSRGRPSMAWPTATIASRQLFFQPKFAGQTFGFGQLSPLAALMVTDLVHEKNPDEPLLDMNNAPEVYSAVMKPDRTLQYIAAMHLVARSGPIGDRRLRHFPQPGPDRDAL